MLFIKLDSLETAYGLTHICEQYKDKMDVDIKYGRYMVDGCNALAVASFIGKIVTICPRTKDKLLIEYFYKDIRKIGSYIINKETTN